MPGGWGQKTVAAGLTAALGSRVGLKGLWPALQGNDAASTGSGHSVPTEQ